MATWEEMIDGRGYDISLQSYRDRLEQARARNRERMAEANPGFNPGAFSGPTREPRQSAFGPNHFTLEPRDMTDWIDSQEAIVDAFVPEPEGTAAPVIPTNIGDGPYRDDGNAENNRENNGNGGYMEPIDSAFMNFMFPGMVAGYNSLVEDNNSEIDKILDEVMNTPSIGITQTQEEEEELDRILTEIANMDTGGDSGGAVEANTGTNAPGVTNPTGSGMTGQVGLQGNAGVKETKTKKTGALKSILDQINSMAMDVAKNPEKYGAGNGGNGRSFDGNYDFGGIGRNTRSGNGGNGPGRGGVGGPPGGSGTGGAPGKSAAGGI